MDAKQTLSELLAARMKRAGLNDAALAAALCEVGTPIDPVTVFRYRKGQRIPVMSHGKSLCRVLNIPAAKLLEAAELQAQLRKAA